MAWRDQVKTVVLVILENRSFDHLLGHLSFENLVPVNGLRSPLTNYQNLYKGGVFNPFVLQRDDPLVSDLPHEFNEVATQLSPVLQGPITMGGFVSSYATYRLIKNPTDTDPGPQPDCIGFFPSDVVPITSFLARNFCTCDRWHCPLPTSTQPNRTMAWNGASGIHDTSSGLRIIGTDNLIVNWLEDHGLRWRVYHDGLPFFALYNQGWGHLFGDGFKDFENYLNDMKTATPQNAPQVIIVEPSYNDGPHIGPDHPNDNHPPLAVGWGEDFLRRVYEAATVNPDIWAQTVMVVYYDEHGGFFDHVPPPAIGYQTKENPPYAFATMGPRIPGIIASPMVKPGSVCSTLFDHTSVLQFLAETFTPGQPYSNDVDARKQQGIASLSAALADQPQRAKDEIPAVPAQPIPVASALGDNIAAPPRTAMQSAFELAAEELLKQHPVETTKKFPELVHWKAAVDAAR